MFSHRYFFMITLLGFSLVVANEQQSHVSHSSLIHRIKNSLANQFGTEQLAPEKEKLIRSIMQEMGIIKNIEIRKMNRHGMTTFGLYNAFAYLDSYLFFSEHFFTKLNTEEQRFLIGHELMHIEQRYVYKQSTVIWGNYFANVALCWYAYQLLNKKRLSSKMQRPLIIGLHVALNIINKLNELRRARYFEQDADKESAIRLKCAQGGISFLKKMKQLTDDFPLQGNYDYSTWWKRLWANHPNNEKREKYLQEISKNQTTLKQ